MEVAFAAVAVALPFCVAAAQPREVLAFAATQGEGAALAKFFACDSSGDKAYAQVSSGSRQWLSVAVRILPYADACYTQSLDDAIARAVVPTTSRVLALVDSSPQLKAAKICVPFLSAEDPAAGHLAYLARAERSLRRVRARELQSAKRACLGEIAGAREAVRRMSSNTSVGTDTQRRAAPSALVLGAGHLQR